jgi:hypothetical protein
MKLDHLASFTLKCPCADIGRDLLIRVRFSSHCYTKGYDPEVHKPHEVVVREGKDRHRVFCPDRYQLSHSLRGRIEELPTKKVHQTSQSRNYVYIVPLEIGGNPYEIYFMLQRTVSGGGSDLRLSIESAYVPHGKLNARKRPNSIRFPVLAYKVLNNQPIRFAAR